jgi:hypothetical protein
MREFVPTEKLIILYATEKFKIPYVSSILSFIHFVSF